MYRWLIAIGVVLLGAKLGMYLADFLPVDFPASDRNAHFRIVPVKDNGWPNLEVSLLVAGMVFVVAGLFARPRK